MTESRSLQLRLRASNIAFWMALAILGSTYILLIVAMFAADMAFVVGHSHRQAIATDHYWMAMAIENPVMQALSDAKIQYAIRLSLISCSLAAIACGLVAVPLAYLLSRTAFPGRGWVEATLDIPLVLPPLVVGLSLLILFQYPPLSWIAREVVYQIPAVILAQWAVSCAYAVRTMKVAFDQIDPRCEQVALTLGCSRFQAFRHITFPEARQSILAVMTLSWARSLGEFGPLLIFAGATRMKTEVLSTSVFLEMNVGNVEGAVAVSLLMIAVSIVVTLILRWANSKGPLKMVGSKAMTIKGLEVD